MVKFSSIQHTDSLLSTSRCTLSFCIWCSDPGTVKGHRFPVQRFILHTVFGSPWLPVRGLLPHHIFREGSAIPSPIPVVLSSLSCIDLITILLHIRNTAFPRFLPSHQFHCLIQGFLLSAGAAFRGNTIFVQKICNSSCCDPSPLYIYHCYCSLPVITCKTSSLVARFSGKCTGASLAAIPIWNACT